MAGFTLTDPFRNPLEFPGAPPPSGTLAAVVGTGFALCYDLLLSPTHRRVPHADRVDVHELRELLCLALVGAAAARRAGQLPVGMLPPVAQDRAMLGAATVAWSLDRLANVEFQWRAVEHTPEGRVRFELQQVATAGGRRTPLASLVADMALLDADPDGDFRARVVELLMPARRSWFATHLEAVAEICRARRLLPELLVIDELLASYEAAGLITRNPRPEE